MLDPLGKSENQSDDQSHAPLFSNILTLAARGEPEDRTT
jgi:hypothetical protein